MALVIARKQLLMFGQNLPEAKIDEKETDLFVRSALGVHFVQDTNENDIGPGDAYCGDYEEV